MFRGRATHAVLFSRQVLAVEPYILDRHRAGRDPLGRKLAAQAGRIDGAHVRYRRRAMRHVADRAGAQLKHHTLDVWP